MEIPWDAVLAIGSVGTLIIALWRAVVWFRERSGEELEKIYRPLYAEVRKIVEQIEAFSVPRSPLTGELKFATDNWLKVRESKLITRIPSEITKKLKDFYDKTLPEYIDVRSVVERSIKYDVCTPARIMLDKTIKDAIKAGKEFSWGHSHKSWTLDTALADVLTPQIIKGKDVLGLDLDLLDKDLSRGVKESLHPQESMKEFLQVTARYVEEDPSPRIFRETHDRVLHSANSIKKTLEDKISKIES